MVLSLALELLLILACAIAINDKYLKVNMNI